MIGGIYIAPRHKYEQRALQKSLKYNALQPKYINLQLLWWSDQDSIQDLTYVWRTRACENYLGIKIIKNDTHSNVL